MDERRAWRPKRWANGWFDGADPCGETGFYGSVFAANGRKGREHGIGSGNKRTGAGWDVRRSAHAGRSIL